MINKNSRKLMAATLAVCFVAYQSLMFQASATDITGVTGNNGVFNIDPAGTHGSIGFRDYENFNLSEGDIANLIFKYGNKNIETFLNMVDNKININGIVNSMRDGNFYNGRAIFVSPNGMVVGASGVLNVGSLSVYTPTQQSYNDFKTTQNLDSIKQGNADVTINGKVLARENIEIAAKNVALGANSALISGVANTDVFNSKDQAQVLFNQLVNTNATTANSISSENGKIYIKADNPQGGIVADGTIKNFAKGNITLTNDGVNGLKVAGNIENANGNTLISSTVGSLDVAGKVDNKGNITFTNEGEGGLYVSGNLNNTDGNILLVNKAGNMYVSGTTDNENGLTALKNNSGELNISGSITNNNGRVSITNDGTKLTLASTGTISSDGSTVLLNKGSQGTDLAGKVLVSDANFLVQNEAGTLNIGGEVVSGNGDIRILNNGDKLVISSTGKISNNKKTEILNNGANGLNLDGTVEHSSGELIVQSNAGDMNVNGKVSNLNGKTVVSNYSGALNLNETSSVSGNGETIIYNEGKGGMNLKGSVDNTGDTNITNEAGSLIFADRVKNANGKLAITNNGLDLTVGATANIKNEGQLTMLNNGENGMTVDGVVENEGNAILTNQAGNMTVNGKVNNSEKLNITNHGKGLYLAGDVQSKTARVWNTGSDGAKVLGTLVTNGTLDITNAGEGGLNLDGIVSGNQKTTVTNTAGALEIGGKVDTTGNVNITNSGSGIQIKDTGVVHNKDGAIFVQNTGADGFKVDGTISNAKGNTTVINRKGSVVVGGSINNSDGKLGITNYGKGVNLTGKLSNNNELRVLNYGTEGTQLDGVIENSGNTIINNRAQDLNINGIIDNKDGNVSITNTGNALNFGKDSKVINNSSVRVVNSGNGGMTVDGTIKNTKSTALTNNAGKFIVNGTIENTNGNLNITNKGTALVTGKDSNISNTNGEVLIQNLGEDGMTLNGHINNGVSKDADGNVMGTAGTTSITNVKGDLKFTGSIASQDDLVIINDGRKLNAESTSGIVSGGPVKIINNGEQGMNLAGGIIGFDSIAVTNRSGDLNISGTIANQDANMNITNTGNRLDIHESAQILNSDELLIQNTGEGGLDISGSLNTNSQVTILNKAGNLDIKGKINNQSNSLIISNYGTGLEVSDNAEINNDKNIRFVNYGENGTRINGKVQSQNDIVQFINRNGELEVNGEVKDVNNK